MQSITVNGREWAVASRFTPDRSLLRLHAIRSPGNFRSRLHLSLCTLTLCILVLAGCATQEVAEPAPPAEPEYWSLSRTVESDFGMVTLFDPVDLSHHAADPQDWYRYDFAFASDLDTGRFVAVIA